MPGSSSFFFNDAETCGSNYIHVSVDGLTPLAMAAANGYTEAVQWLLRHGANYKLKDKYEEVPLHKVTIFFFCTDRHFPPSVYFDLRSRRKEHAIYVFDARLQAAFEGHLGCVQALLHRSPDTSRKDADGATALHHASYNGHVLIVKELLRYVLATGFRIISLYFVFSHPHPPLPNTICGSLTRVGIRRR